MEGGVWNFINEINQKKGISEIIINNVDNVYVEREGALIRLNTRFAPDDIKKFCQDVAQYNKVQFGNRFPILDGVLPDGSRINIVASEYTLTAPAITIRKYLQTIKSFEQNDGVFGLSPKWVTFLKTAVHAKCNIIISGGTGTGKTTMLNLLLNEAHPTERIVTIEDTKELSFPHANSVRLISRGHSFTEGISITTETLLKNTLRMRPDRIIIGEVRGGETFELLQAMNTGHEGSMCTVHANSSPEALSRLENLFLYSGKDIPLKAIRMQMSKAIDFVIQLSKSRDGNRLVARVTEIVGMEGDNIIMQDIGKAGENGPEFTGLVPKCIEKLKKYELSPSFFADL